MSANQETKRKVPCRYFFATVLILLGLLIAGKNTGYVDERLYYALISWPMILILIGIYNLLNKKNHRQHYNDCHRTLLHSSEN